MVASRSLIVYGTSRLLCSGLSAPFGLHDHAPGALTPRLFISRSYFLVVYLLCVLPWTQDSRSSR